MTERMTIRELSAATGISVHTLRYYERAGLMPPVARHPGSGHRRYEDRHLRWVRFLRHLRSAGMPIAQVTRYVEFVRQETAGDRGRLDLLAEHRDSVMRKIEELQGHLAVLNAKLARGCGPHDDPPGRNGGVPE